MPSRALPHALIRVLGAALLAGAAASPAAAQQDSPPDTSAEKSANPFGTRVAGGIALVYAAPQDEFKTYVDQGWGINGNLLVKLDPAGVLALRVDAGFVNYGSTRTRVPLSPTTGNLILVDLNTTHNIFLGGVGLQLQAPAGPIRPYVGGTVGLGSFFTQTTIEGSDNDNQPFAQSTNQRDHTFAWTGLGGIAVPLNRDGSFLLDLGVTYQANGEATYLPPGVVEDANGNPILQDPVRSSTDMLLYRVGVRFGF